MRLSLVPLLLLSCSCAVSDYIAARGRDLMDCVKGNVGVGLGLAVDVHATDYVSPGVGFASYTINTGWDDRRVNGVWRESVVINTPRVAYEVLAERYEAADGGVEPDRAITVSQLMLSSLFLPNERWIRAEDGPLTVEHYSLFNFGGLSSHRATVGTGYLRRGGEMPQVPDKDVWQRGFFEVGATAGVVHARLGVNPLQVFDFLAGLVGLDPAGDDDDAPIVLRSPR